MNLREYQKETDRAIPSHNCEEEEILHWCIGLSEECGEIMSIIKHHYFGGEEFDRESLVKECGDVLWYLAALCRSCNINLAYVARINVEKINHRYPGGDFNEARSENRHDLEKKFTDTPFYKTLLQLALSYKENET